MNNDNSEINNSEKWQEYIGKLLTACEDMAVTVQFSSGADDSYDPEEKIIAINTRRKLENQLNILLHELGHHMICEDKRLNKKFAPIKYSARSLSAQILAIEEEVLAWHFGEELAIQYGIEIGSSFQKLKAHCLKSHIRAHNKIIK